VEAGRQSRLVRFGVFEADLQAGELRKAGAKLKLSGQPFQVLTILLEHPGEVVTREELQKRLWPDTFVDVDHNLNTAINKIREVLADSAESPRYVETLPRRGYRFIAPVESDRPDATSVRKDTIQEGGWRAKALRFGLLSSAVILLASAGVFLYKRLQTPVPQAQRTLTRVTFDDGLQIGVTWSPDSRFIAYSSDHGGKFDIWVQQISGGDPLQITKGPGNNWQPDWSPDGKWIAYRSEDGEGGLYMIPALGGAGLVRKVTTFGYYPRWSPDSSKILFQTSPFRVETRFYLATLDGNPPHEILAGLSALYRISPISATWHPDGKRVTVWLWGQAPSPNFLTAPVAGGTAVRSEIAPAIARQLGEISGNQLTWIFSGYADLKFSWAPSGRAIYFERTFRDARNFWKMSIDPETLRATAIERLTTGPGLDTEFAVSPDGKKIAFTEESRHIRGWLLPFDASRGQVLGPGQAVTSLGIEAWLLNLSRDGKKVAFVSNRAGIRQIEERALQVGPEAPVVADAEAYSRTYPQWSPDGTRLVYFREAYSTGQGQLMLWSSHSRGRGTPHYAREDPHGGLRLVPRR
jgi:Tol biopolymer transport system component/DNA-binding winged helix-turn-helix (wHTH) protein